MDTKVVGENEWVRILETDTGALLTESRFLNKQFIVPAERITTMWQTMTNDEQLDFLTAFLARAKLQEEDKKILDFLMGVDDEKVWIMIAPLMTKYPDRDRALKFLLDKIETDSEGLANCYHALEVMNDARAVEVVRRKYEAYKDRFRTIGSGMGTIALVDFAYSCSMLRRLETNKEYETVLRELKTVDDERVRNQADRILRR